MKIIKSQNEDIQELITQISEIQNDSQTLTTQLNCCLVLEQQQQELIDYYKKKDKGAYIYGNIATSLPGLMLMTYGFIQMGNNNADVGWTYFKVGAITLGAMEIVYQGGHWAFRWW